MILIFGGAYQGKLEYAMEEFNLKKEDVFICKKIREMQEDKIYEIDFTKKAIYGLEHFIFECVRYNVEAKDYLATRRVGMQDKIVICTDISCGIAPKNKTYSEWREMTGRTINYLGKEADSIIRVFCGLPQKLK